MKNANKVSCSLELGDKFGRQYRLVINSPDHEQPLFWRSYSHDHLLAMGKFLQSPGLPLAALLEQPPDTLPSQVQKLLSLAPSDMGFALLQAVLSSAQAEQLAAANPFLFILLVNFASTQQISTDKFRLLVSSKRTVILQRLGLPDSKQLIRILARCRFQLIGYQDMRMIELVLKQPIFTQLLSHLSRPSIAVFYLLHKLSLQPQLASQNLIAMLQSNPLLGRALRLGSLVLDCQQLGTSRQQIVQLRSEQQLEKLQQRLRQDFLTRLKLSLQNLDDETAVIKPATRQTLTVATNLLHPQQSYSIGQIQRQFKLGYSAAVQLATRLHSYNLAASIS